MVATRGIGGLTFDMSGGPKGAERPLARPLDGGVRRHGLRGRGGFPNSASVGQPHTWRAALAVTRSPHDLEHRLCSIVDMVATPR